MYIQCYKHHLFEKKSVEYFEKFQHIRISVYLGFYLCGGLGAEREEEVFDSW